MALDRARSRQRPRNRQWASAGCDGAPCSRGQSEREGERVGQRAQIREDRWASRAQGSKGARAHERGRRTRGRGRVHGGEIVGGRLRTADRWGWWGRERESGRTRGNQRRQVWPTGQRERGGERGRSGLRRQAGPARQTHGARGRGHARKLGRLGLTGPDWLFLFLRNFYLLFYLFSLGFSIQIQIKFQIQTKSNICNNSKNI
jgi:hypothetical protein